MLKSIQLNIPEPCHENWNSMTAREQGRFCGSCQKTVVDFSMMTDKEIVDYISKASHHVCGRLSNDQLNKALPVTTTKRRFSLAYVWNILLATLLITKANAQVKPVKPKKPVITNTPTRITMGMIAYKPETAVVPVEVKGRVFDSVTHQPVDGATIRIKETEEGTSADSLGNFVFPVEKKNAVVLDISAIGYETQTLIIDRTTNWQNLNVFLKPVATELSKVEVIGYPVMGKVSVVGSVSRIYTDTTTEKIKKVVGGLMPASLLKKDLKIYPNPVVRGNNVQANLALQQAGEYKLELLNAGGQVMLVQPVQMQTSKQLVTIPTHAAWSAGIYWVRISAPGSKNVYQAKVLLQ